MTSATQSNSGASAYLGFLHALAGSPDILEMTHLESETVQNQVRKLLAKVDRSSGSSGWLKDSMVTHPDRYEAMFNYEAMIIEANQELKKGGREPLYAVYPRDGIMIADSPLGFINKGSADKEKLFLKLQAYLLSEAVQKGIQATGRRTGLIGMSMADADRAVFNPDWGIDINRIISPVPTPGEAVIRRALELFQTVLRKPSLTAYVVDVSGSMEGQGIFDLKAALTTLLNPDQARRYMLQASPRDIHIIVPFSGSPHPEIIETGNANDIMDRLSVFVNNLTPGGGTDIYSASVRAIELILQVPNLEDYFPSVILMTDGRSKGDFQAFKNAIDRIPADQDVPVFSITFGDADETQLKQVSELTYGRVFHGKDLIQAFRNAKGYN